MLDILYVGEVSAGSACCVARPGARRTHERERGASVRGRRAAARDSRSRGRNRGNPAHPSGTLPRRRLLRRTRYPPPPLLPTLYGAPYASVASGARRGAPSSPPPCVSSPREQ